MTRVCLLLISPNPISRVTLTRLTLPHAAVRLAVDRNLTVTAPTSPWTSPTGSRPSSNVPPARSSMVHQLRFTSDSVIQLDPHQPLSNTEPEGPHRPTSWSTAAEGSSLVSAGAATALRARSGMEVLGQVRGLQLRDRGPRSGEGTAARGWRFLVR